MLDLLLTIFALSTGIAREANFLITNIPVNIYFTMISLKFFGFTWLGFAYWYLLSIPDKLFPLLFKSSLMILISFYLLVDINNVVIIAQGI